MTPAASSKTVQYGHRKSKRTAHGKERVLSKSAGHTNAALPPIKFTIRRLLYEIPTTQYISVSLFVFRLVRNSRYDATIKDSSVLQVVTCAYDVENTFLLSNLIHSIQALTISWKRWRSKIWFSSFSEKRTPVMSNGHSCARLRSLKEPAYTSYNLA